MPLLLWNDRYQTRKPVTASGREQALPNAGSEAAETKAVRPRHRREGAAALRYFDMLAIPQRIAGCRN